MSSRNPVSYLESQTSEIIFNLSKENFLSHSEAQQVLGECIRIVCLLEESRPERTKTFNILDQNLPNDGVQSFIIHWILKAINGNKTYKYAYNKLAQKVNREVEDNIYQVNTISEIELLDLLDSESLQKNIERNKWTGKILALYIHYLKKARYLKKTQKTSIEFIQKKYDLHYSSKSISNNISYIFKGNPKKDPATAKNLEAVIDLLKLYPKAQDFAKSDYNDIISDVSFSK